MQKVLIILFILTMSLNAGSLRDLFYQDKAVKEKTDITKISDISLQVEAFIRSLGVALK